MRDSDAFTATIAEASANDEDLLRYLSLLLIPLGRLGFSTPERAKRLFNLGESMGVHILPTHFYSPVPNTAELDASVWNQPFPFRCDDHAMEELIRELGLYATELDDVAEKDAPGVFHWDNPSICRGDAFLNYSMLRHLRPTRVIEVGCGYSTLLAREASRHTPFRLECIEPYPYDWLHGVPDELIELPIQKVARERFSSLGSGDVLFIDSTHVAKVGSDVVHLFLRVLPELRPGVAVHIHDVFLPFEYARAWVMEHHLFWNEQYLLAAFLQSNQDWEVLVGNSYAADRMPTALLEAFPGANPPGGVSFWMRRKLGN
ncbi:MAG: class I SAM-dependent methyltransferase [Bryobacteraceae bacterium]